MDKKKVIENLKQVELYINKLQGLDYTQLQLLRSAIFRLHDAQDELKRPDWISVEDKLPPYRKDVLVKSERTANIIQTYRDDFDEDDGMFHPFRDKNDFVLNEGIHGRISHWCKIDKLEV